MNKLYNFQNYNPCTEIIGVDDYFDKLLGEAKGFMEKRENHRRNLVNHLQTVGWNINHEWLDEVSKKSDPNGDDVLRRTIWGLHDGDYHLISKCGKFIVRIKSHIVVFWKKIPEWKEIANIALDEIEFTDRGIKYDEILEISII